MQCAKALKIIVCRTDVDHEMVEPNPAWTATSEPNAPMLAPPTNNLPPESTTHLNRSLASATKSGRKKAPAESNSEEPMICSPASRLDESTYIDASSTPATVARQGTRGLAMVAEDGTGSRVQSVRRSGRSAKKPPVAASERKSAAGRILGALPMDGTIVFMSKEISLCT